MGKGDVVTVPYNEKGTDMEKFTTEFEGYELRGIGERSMMCGTDKVMVIGIRRATPYGLALADMAGRVVAELGLTLLTSAAIGCGAQAARAAKQAGGKVIAVSAVGLDVPRYPAASKDVFDSADLLLSVVDDDTPPIPFNFQKRNEIMAHMSDAVIVCEAGMPSGVTTTADEAIRVDKTVFAFPGSVYSPASKGCNWLIEGGAKPVLSENDLTDKLRRVFALPAYEAVDNVPLIKDGIMRALIANPMRADELAHAFDKQVLDIMRELASLEMNGRVERLPDGRYSPAMRRLVFY